MKKIMVVGYMKFGDDLKLADKYPDVIWFFNREIKNIDKPMGIVEAVDVMDAVLFTETGTRERLAWEIACIMKNRTMYELTDYPVDEKVEEKDNAETI